MSKTVLLKFDHGIGDAAQFTVVLKHLRKHHGPGIIYDVVSGRGKHSAFNGLCRRSYFKGEPMPDESAYNEVHWVGWYENYCGYTDRPNSKITNCLEEEFHIPYDPALGRYSVAYTEADARRACEYLTGIGAKLQPNGKFKVVVLHYEGNTSTEKKNLGHHHARAVCEAVAAAGGKVVLLDWDNRSPIPNSTTVNKPAPGPNDIWGGFGSGDAAMIAALVSQCAGFIGIDSGPGKCASATNTPCGIVWTGHHPLQFHDPAENVVHIIPENHAGIPPISGNPNRLAYFTNHYKHRTYEPKNGLELELTRMATQMCGGNVSVTDEGLIKHGPVWVRADNFAQDLVIVQDVFYGDCYRSSLYDLKQWSAVVDVGAHIGCFATLVHHMNPDCKIVCVEACPENIPALRKNVGHFATVIHAAMTYEPGELALLNAVRPNCDSTGGSVVVSRASLDDPANPMRQAGYQYWPDTRPLRKIGLGEAMIEGGISHVDCLKLDCEGAEISILRHAPELPRVRFVWGEYHDQPVWEALRAERLSAWNYGKIYEGGGRGLFHLINPYFKADALVETLIPKISEEPGARDIWRYYQGDAAATEIRSWGAGTPRHIQNAATVDAIARRFGLTQVLEFACGSGVMSRLIDPDLDCHGLDRCGPFIRAATLDAAKGRAGKGVRNFTRHDWRDPIQFEADNTIVCAFAALKHFPLSDLDFLFDRLVAAMGKGAVLVFDVNLAGQEFDDGIDFHHSHVTLSRVQWWFRKYGFTEVSREVYWEGLSATTGRPVAETTFVATRGAVPPAEMGVDELGAALAGVERAAGAVPSFIAAADEPSYQKTYLALIGSGRALVIVVDDYRPFEPAHPVTCAVRWWAIKHGYRVRDLVFQNRPRCAVIDRRVMLTGKDHPEIGTRNNRTLKIALPPGIGDAAWVVTKLPAIRDLLGASGFDLELCGSERAVEYIQALPLCRVAGANALAIVDDPPVKESGVTGYNYAPSQPGWHGRFDLFLQANEYLECGHDLEDWLNNIPTDYRAPADIIERVDDSNFADDFARRGPYVTFFAGPLDGNTVAGHNIGGTWTPGDWASVAKQLIDEGIRVVLLGYGPGDSDYNLRCLYPAGFYDNGAEDCVGIWDLPRTLAVVKRASGHVGYQSGLGVLSVYNGIPAAMFWQQQGIPLSAAGATFSESMATAWVPEKMISANRYMGAIYGRKCAQDVVWFIISAAQRYIAARGRNE